MEFNVNPYYDDFETTGGPRENNYMRVLFKPGYAVQARELTQIQSILQNQIKQFGDHIFKDGSPVMGGHMTLDTNIKSIKLQSQYDLEDISVSDFNNQLIINDTGTEKKRAVVLAVDDSQTNPTLMIRYLRGIDFINAETIRLANTAATKATLIASSAQSVGSVVSINEGVFYVDGYFVYVAPQSIVLDPYSTTPTYRVGLEIQEAIINSSQDSSLLDPAQGSFNYQAPGADRFQFNLVLAKRELSSTDDSKFFELLRVENGLITKQVNYPIYSEIEKTLARRTYDESGDYTVFPWQAVATDNADTTKFDVSIEKGKAYIKGFEFQTDAITKITSNKARTTANNSDYELSVEYGNYLVVTNLYSGNNGFIDTAAFGLVDLHTVPSASINTQSLGAYTNTKIGTARVRNITRKGDNTFYAYLLDINTSPTIVNALAGSTATTITFPSTYSTLANAYANVFVSVIAGDSVGDLRQIVSYDGTTKVATVNRPFNTTLTTNSQLALKYGVKDIDSLVVTPSAFTQNVYSTQPASANVFPSMDVDVTGKSSLYDAQLYETSTNKLIFKFPESYIANGSFSNAYYYHRKLIKNKQFTSASATLTVGSGDFDANEEIYYGADGSNLSGIQANNNILVIVKDKQASNTTNGQIINFATRGAGAYILRTGNTNVTLASGYNATFTADIYINVKVNNSSSTNRRTKTLKGNTARTTLLSTDSPNNGTAVTGQSTVKIDTANAHVWFTDSTIITKTPGVKQSLYIPDAFRIIKIYESGNNQFAPNTTNARDITANYLFDSGQNDNYYDHSSIILKDHANPPSGQTVIMLQYFDHSLATSGYFNADSYDYNTVYSQGLIPLYNSRSGGSYSLRDAIDFRPTRTAGTTAFTLAGAKIPFPELSMTLNYGFYLPRIDKLIATQNKEFKMLAGSPAYVPQEPSDSDEGMTLYTIYIPPFTTNVKDIKFKYYDNRRYTMRDIGILDKRIQRIEYYTALSLLENKARSQSVLYQDAALQKEKYGILVDQFDGFNIADNKNLDLVCQLSFNELKPYKIVKPLSLTFSHATGSYIDNDKTFSLSYSETPVVSQNTATKAISVQPYLFGQFNGQLNMTPDSDYWVNEILTPAVVSPPTDFVTPAIPPVIPISQPTTGTPTPIAPVEYSTNTAIAETTTTPRVEPTAQTNPVQYTTTINPVTYTTNITTADYSVGTNFVGYGFIDWTPPIVQALPAPIPSTVIQQAVVTPDISNSLPVPQGGGVATQPAMLSISGNIGSDLAAAGSIPQERYQIKKN